MAFALRLTPAARRRWTALIGLTCLATIPMVAAINAGVARAADPAENVIVVLDSAPAGRARDVTNRLIADYDIVEGVSYTSVLQGFSASLPASQIDEVRSEPGVAFVVPDHEMSVAGEIPEGVRRVQAKEYLATGGVGNPIDGDIAVLDTGVKPHRDLNVVRSIDCAKRSGCSGRSATDVFGHGTHVAGTAAASNDNSGVSGVAQGARVWNVRVFDDYGYGPLSYFIAALD